MRVSNVSSRPAEPKQRSFDDVMTEIMDRPSVAGPGGCRICSFKFTQQDAVLILQYKNHDNRNVIGNHLATLVQERSDGHWYPCLDAIVFSADFELWNGQHRFSMLEKLGGSEEFIVVWDAPPDSKLGLDRGRPWSFAARAGLPNDVVAALSVIHALLYASTIKTHTRLRELHAEYECALDVVVPLARRRKATKRGPFVGAFALAVSHEGSREQVLELLEDITAHTGAQPMTPYINRLLERESWLAGQERHDGALKLLRGIECHIEGTVSTILRPTTSGLLHFAPQAKYRARNPSPSLSGSTRKR